MSPCPHRVMTPPMRRLLVTRKGLSSVRVMYRQPRSEIVVSDDSSEESDEELERDAEARAEADRVIAQVVSECAGVDELENSGSHLFASPPNSPIRASLDQAAGNGDAVEGDIHEDSRAGFQDKDKSKEPGKKDKERASRKDNVTSKHLSNNKMKEIF